MSGEQNLQTLLKSLSARLVDGVFVFVTLSDRQVPISINPRMMFMEDEGTTIICLKSEAEAAGLDYTYPCRMITLDVHSSLDAVGFMARIASELAAQGMGVNPVAGFYHDHLFVPDGRQNEALDVLRRIAIEADDID
ncbi:MAG: ACT domain-containing protein [Pseudomonadota bacterium]